MSRLTDFRSSVKRIADPVFRFVVLVLECQGFPTTGPVIGVASVSFLSYSATVLWTSILIVYTLLTLLNIAGAVDQFNGLLAARAILFAILIFRNEFLAEHGPAKCIFRLCLRMALPVCGCLLAAAVMFFIFAAREGFQKAPSYLMCGGLLLYCAWNLHQFHVHRGGRTIVSAVTSIELKDILLAGVASFLCLAALELAVHIVYPQTHVKPTGLYVPHRTRIFDLAPNVRGRYEDEDFSLNFKTNSYGLKNPEIKPKTPETFRVLCVGDSFTMGHGTSIEESFPGRLEQLFRIKHPETSISVINFGVGGYGPWQQLSKMRENGFELEPDMVILQLFAENDIRDELRRVDKLMRSCDPEWQRRLDVMAKKQTGFWRRWRFFLRRHSHLFVLADDRWDVLRRRMVRQNVSVWYHNGSVLYTAIPGRPWWLETSLKEYYPELEEGWHLLESSVRELRDECKRRNIPMYAFAMPAQYEVNVRMAPDIASSAGADDSLYDFAKNRRLTTLMLERLDIPIIDVHGPMMSERDQSRFYWKHDAHLNAAGQEFVAALLESYVWKEYSMWIGQHAKPHIDKEH